MISGSCLSDGMLCSPAPSVSISNRQKHICFQLWMTNSLCQSIKNVDFVWTFVISKSRSGAKLVTDRPYEVFTRGQLSQYIPLLCSKYSWILFLWTSPCPAEKHLRHRSHADSSLLFYVIVLTHAQQRFKCVVTSISTCCHRKDQTAPNCTFLTVSIL